MMRGNCAVSSLAPVEPTVSSLVRRSAKVLTGDVFHETQTLTSLLALPSQAKSVPLKAAPGSPSSGSKPVPRLMMPKAVPSFGAIWASQLASRRLPAPSMFSTTIVGLPGIWRPMKRATMRP